MLPQFLSLFFLFYTKAAVSCQHKSDSDEGASNLRSVNKLPCIKKIYSNTLDDGGANCHITLPLTGLWIAGHTLDHRHAAAPVGMPILYLHG